MKAGFMALAIFRDSWTRGIGMTPFLHDRCGEQFLIGQEKDGC